MEEKPQNPAQGKNPKGGSGKDLQKDLEKGGLHQDLPRLPHHAKPQKEKA